MNSLKLGLVFPGIVFSVLITVIGVGIYQLNSDENPWNRKNQKYNVTMEPKMVNKPAIKIAGFVLKTKTKNGKHIKAVPKFWYNYCTDGRQEKLHNELFLKNHEEYGASFPENPKNGEFEYVIGLEVEEGHDIPKGYHVYTIPEALYAVFTTPPVDESRFTSSIQSTWKYIFNEWLPKSGYEFAANGVNLELYDEQNMNNTDKIANICIPVVMK
jgi:AraC family transcriptional regulator